MSIRRSLEALFAALLLAAGAVTMAAEPPPGADASERRRIARERAEAEARGRAAEAACAREFAVSACLRQARSERRTTLRQLDRQQALLEEAQRKQRAAQRLARIRERQEAAAREPARPPVEVRSRNPRAPAPEPAASQVAGVEAAQALRAASAAAAASAADAKAARRAEASAARARKAEAHRAAVEARSRERATQNAPAASLPVPASVPR